MSSAWATLFVAALFETVWAVGLEYSDGLSNLRATAVVVVAMAISVALLSRAVQSLPVGTAYAVWTGIGAVSTAALGVALFDEPVRARPPVLHRRHHRRRRRTAGDRVAESGEGGRGVRRDAGHSM